MSYRVCPLNPAALPLPQVKAILAAVRGKPEPARCVLVSATMTKAVRRLVGARARWGCGATLGGRDHARPPLVTFP